jgi:hypothetical protein
MSKLGPNNLNQSIPSMDIIFLVAKICHTTSFADFSSNNYEQGIQYLEPGNGLKQAIKLFTHYTTCQMRTRRTASLQAITFLMIDQNQNSTLVEFMEPYFNIICRFYCTNFKVGNLKS